MTERFDIFISHNSLDKQLIDPIIERLYDEFEIRSWLDRWDLHASAEWEPAIRHALESCRACAVVLGANGWGPYHVQEARFALERKSREPGFIIIPILLPGADQRQMAVLGDFFQRTHRVDFSNGVGDEEAFRRLVSAIRGEAPGPPPLTVFSVNRAARQWEQAAVRDRGSILYRGGELRDAQNLVTTHAGMLSNAAVKFLSASAEAEQLSIQAERKRTRRIITGLISGLLILAVTAVFALAKRSEAITQAGIAEKRRLEAEEQTRIANEQRRTAQSERERADKKAKEAEESAEAERQARIEEKKQREIAITQRDMARSRELAANAEAQISIDPQLSMLLAVEAEKIAHTAQAEKALRFSIAQSQVRTVLNGHQDALSKAVFSPDGKLIATASWDNKVIIWDAQTGTQLWAGEGTDRVRDLDFSPDGALLVTGSGKGRAQIWNVRSGNIKLELTGHRGEVWNVAFSPSGRFVLTRGDNTVRIWRVSNGRTVYKLESAEFGVASAVFSPDGNLIATAGKEGAQIWDFDTGKLLYILRGHQKGINDIRFSPDSKRVITAGSDKTVRVWDATTGTMLSELRGHTEAVNTACFSPDGEAVVTTSDDDTARVWELRTGISETLSGHANSVKSAVFSPDGRFVVTASQDKTARVWKGGIHHSIAVLRGHNDNVETAVFSPDGQSVLTASWDGTARVWSPSNGREFRVLSGHNDGLLSGAFSPDNKYVITASTDKTARVWDVMTGQTVAKLEGHEARIWQASFSPDGKLVATVSDDGTARLWDPLMGKEIAKLTVDSYSGRLVSFSPDGKLMAASGAVDVHLYDVARKKQIGTLKARRRAVSISFSPDSKLLVSGLDNGKSIVWNVTTKSRVHELVNAEGGTVKIAMFSPNGRFIYTSGFGRPRLWDVRTGKLVHELKGKRAVLDDAAFSPDSRFVATPAEVWDVNSGQLVTSFSGESSVMSHVQFSNDSKLVLTTAGDGPKLREVETGREILALTGGTGRVSGVRFSSDGRFILTISDNKTASIYRCDVCDPIGRLLNVASRSIRRQLSPAERLRLLTSH